MVPYTEIEREELAQQCLAIITEHVGKDSAITSYQLLVEATGALIIPGRKVDQTRLIRSIVKQLRMDGHAIAGHAGFGGGYYLARNDEELQDTIRWFHKRGLSAFAQEAALKKISLDELFEQYKLELQEKAA